MEGLQCQWQEPDCLAGRKFQGLAEASCRYQVFFPSSISIILPWLCSFSRKSFNFLASLITVLGAGVLTHGFWHSVSNLCHPGKGSPVCSFSRKSFNLLASLITVLGAGVLTHGFWPSVSNLCHPGKGSPLTGWFLQNLVLLKKI